jgi:hypothetical protein
MIRKPFVALRRQGLACGVALALGCVLVSSAQAQQDEFGPARHRHPGPHNLSEATAILESSVRALYKTIEPGNNNDSSPNELMAYADLRSLRLYTGALEVAGWNLEQAADDYERHDRAGAYRGGAGKIHDIHAQIALERFRASRETVRNLLQRVRTSAVLAEHQVSFCDPDVTLQWRQEVLPALRNTIAATDGIFAAEIAFQRYGIPGQQPNNRVIPAGGTGIPNNAIEVTRQAVYKPYEGKGRGQGRYFEIRSYGGPIRVKSVRFRNYESAFGLVGTSIDREVAVDQICEPGTPLHIPCNRNRLVDVGDLEIEWEAVGNRKAYGAIDLIENRPDIGR